MIETQSLAKTYGRGMYALRDLNLKIDKGEFAFLTGPSGAGKSTLLRLLLLEERPSEGEVIVGGRNLSHLTRDEVQAYRRTVGFVFQDFKLIASQDRVRERLVRAARAGPADRTAAPPHLSGAEVGRAAAPAQRLPEELSGGEQQRVAIARALVNEPHLVLADEPTGNLDPDLSLEIMNLFRDINARGTTVLVATHDRELIKWVGRRVIQLEHGRDGRNAGARAVTVVGYAFEEAWASLRRSGRSALVSIGTIAIAFLTLGGFLLVSVNVQGVLDRWLQAAEMSVYLQDTATDAERRRSRQFLQAQPSGGGRGVRVPGARARALPRRFSRTARHHRRAWARIPFPSAIEVRLRTEDGGRCRAPTNCRARCRASPA